MKIERGEDGELFTWPEKHKVYPPKSMETASRTCIMFADDFCALEFVQRILQYLVDQRRQDDSEPYIDAARPPNAAQGQLPSTAPQLPPADEPR